MSARRIAGDSGRARPGPAARGPAAAGRRLRPLARRRRTRPRADRRLRAGARARARAGVPGRLRRRARARRAGRARARPRRADLLRRRLLPRASPASSCARPRPCAACCWSRSRRRSCASPRAASRSCSAATVRSGARSACSSIAAPAASVLFAIPLLALLRFALGVKAPPRRQFPLSRAAPGAGCRSHRLIPAAPRAPTGACGCGWARSAWPSSCCSCCSCCDCGRCRCSTRARSWRRRRATTRSRSWCARRAARSSTTRAACSCATAWPTSSTSIRAPCATARDGISCCCAWRNMLELEPRPLWERVDRQLRMDPVAPVTLASDIDVQAEVVPAGEPGDLPRASRWRRCRCATTRTGRSARTSTGSSARSGPKQLEDPRFHDYHRGDVIGQSGVERRYDAFLRGVDGIDAVTVDAFGQPTGAVRHLKAAVPGRNVRLTIDLDTQRAAEQALAYGVRSDAVGGRERRRARRARPEERRGARTGLVPDVRPELVRLVPQAEVPGPARRASRATAGRPRTTRCSTARSRAAIPAASTFKPFVGDRGRQGAAHHAEPDAAVHAARATTTTSASTTGTTRSTGAST